MDDRIQHILKAQRRTVTVLSSLIAIQEEIGHLPEGAVRAVAALTGATVNDVYAVATFYTHFRFDPPGEHQVELCWGPTCHIEHAPKLKKLAEEFTGLTGDGTTPDRRYTLRGSECSGACALAPVGKVDGKLYGRLTEQRLRGILEATRNGAPRGGEIASARGITEAR